MLDKTSKKILKKLISIYNETNTIEIPYTWCRDHLLAFFNADIKHKIKKQKKFTIPSNNSPFNDFYDKDYLNLLSSLERLERENFIQLHVYYTDAGKQVVYISMLIEGIDYFNSNRRETMRYWYPNIIATIALIASIVAILISLFYPESLLVKLQLI